MNTAQDYLEFEFLAEMREEWRPVPGFPDYTISSFGRVRSLFCLGTKRHGGIMALSRDKRGYRSFLAYMNGKPHRGTLHRLVCEAFHGPPQPGMYACHNDDDKDNNRASNLRWGTPKDNAQDRERNGKGRRRGRS
jgi:hypothetical protein